MRPLAHTARELMKSFVDWLGRVPIDDPIDRRNAPTMQLLFFVIGTTLPISWARHLAVLTFPPSWWWVIAMDMVTSALAFVGIFLIRRGHFRRAVALFLSTLLVGLLIANLTVGFRALLPDQTSQMLLLVISGLMLSRPVLWLVFGALIVIFLSGFWADAQRVGASVAHAFHNLPSVTFSYLVITLILDRSLTALRESLCAAETRGRLLQREMAERERAQAQLVHSQKMEATGRLASGVAHDFNNILSVVMGFTAERHRLDDPDADPRRDARAMAEALEGIEGAAQRGTSLIKKLLSFGRRDPANTEIFDARDTLAELRPMLRQLFPPDVLLEMEMDKDPLPVFIDKAQFELMILNIASNARDAMPDGGSFKVIARRDDTSRSIDILLSDTGQGIDESTQQRVFEPFFSTKPTGSGSGLGLAVTYTLVTGANGDIVLNSVPGGGTTFRIRLPWPNFSA
jgi:signal transduction histidine kinase